MRLKKCLLADTSGTFEDYLKRLSKRGRREYRIAQRDNLGRAYEISEYDRESMGRWMRLWENQSVYGKRPVWSINLSDYDRLNESGALKVFRVGDIGLHAIEHYGEYIYAHPPLYDKATYSELARFMWFGLMEYVAGVADYVDLGPMGHANARYKRVFISKEWRHSPPNLRVQVCACGWRQLVQQKEVCRRCSS